MIRGKVASSGMRLDHLMRGKTFGHTTKGNPRVWRMSSCTDNMNIQNPADGYKSDTLSLLVQVLTGPVQHQDSQKHAATVVDIYIGLYFDFEAAKPLAALITGHHSLCKEMGF